MAEQKCSAEAGLRTADLSHRIKEHKNKKNSACKQREESNRAHRMDYDEVENSRQRGL